MDIAALKEQLMALHPASFSWAVTCCRFDAAEAEDVLQMTYLKIMDGRAQFSGTSSLKTWLFAVIRNTAAARRRSLGRWLAKPTEAPPESKNPEQLTEVAQRRAQVVDALATLPERQRQILDLVFYHDLSIAEAAVVMNVTLGTARTHYERGKVSVAKRLGNA